MLLNGLEATQYLGHGISEDPGSNLVNLLSAPRVPSQDGDDCPSGGAQFEPHPAQHLAGQAVFDGDEAQQQSGAGRVRGTD